VRSPTQRGAYRPTRGGAIRALASAPLASGYWDDIQLELVEEASRQVRAARVPAPWTGTFLSPDQADAGEVLTSQESVERVGDVKASFQKARSIELRGVENAVTLYRVLPRP
jgi:hypothetical protein